MAIILAAGTTIWALANRVTTVTEEIVVVKEDLVAESKKVISALNERDAAIEISNALGQHNTHLAERVEGLEATLKNILSVPAPEPCACDLGDKPE